ncbi:MAG: hypothetical protein KAT34_19260 [Candidatus Aminicenantes bacterium]|nr:hypothetical protein [Candidatus Aminicenantes bacterium]
MDREAAILILISKMFIISGKLKNHTRRSVGFPLIPYAWGSVLVKTSKIRIADTRLKGGKRSSIIGIISNV